MFVAEQSTPPCRAKSSYPKVLTSSCSRRKSDETDKDGKRDWTFGVMADATNAVRELLGVESLRGSFDHIFQWQIRLDSLCDAESLE